MPMAPKYKGLFFDADDTLFDYPRAERAALRACLGQFGLRVGLEAFVATYRRHNRDLWQAFERGETTQAALRVERFRRVAREFNLAPLPLEKVSAYYVEALSRQSQIYPGTLATVRTLAKSYALALITNGLASVQRRRFAASPLTRYFRTVVISEEVGFAKPDPRLFVPAFRATGLEAGEVLSIGDGVTSDMAAARNAGLDFCWFNPAGLPVPDGHAPAHIIADIRELPGRLRGAASPLP